MSGPVQRAVLLALTVSALALGGCKLVKGDDAAQDSDGAAPAGEKMAGPPPLPPYQMRAALPEGDRLAVGRDAESIYLHACGYCHLPAGMGTNLVTKQRVAMGETPEMGLLTNREDLTADYVKQVVRQGKAAMPPQTRVDITDAELDEVAEWLAEGAQ